MDKFFKLKENGTTVSTELFAGLITFMTMSYVLALNPLFMSTAGMDWEHAFTATALSASIACIVMGLLANLPFALGPGVGTGAFFTYTVCLGMGYSWKYALTAVFVEGILFILMSAFKVREAIVSSIPLFLKKSISVGIGFFLAFIGLKNAGIVVADSSNCVALSKQWLSGSALLTVIGLIIIGVMLIKKVKGAFLIGIILITIMGIPFGVTTYAGGSYIPTAPYFFNFAFDEITASSKSIMDFVIVTFVFLFDDMFNTVGTFIGCASKSGIVEEDGSIPNCGRALFSDAVGTTVGAVFGSSTITTFVESSAGVVAGGRTGLTAITTGVLFIFSLFLSPLIGSIPSAATAPILIVVGVMMIEPISEIDFKSDMCEAIPAFLTIIIMVTTSNIANGMMFGVLSFVILMACTGKIKQIKKITWVAFAMFVADAILTIL